MCAHECNCCISSCELVEKDNTKPWRVLPGPWRGPPTRGGAQGRARALVWALRGNDDRRRPGP